ncbi:hypothetical protein DL89DRAFT_175780 [Linderina pennispora]|uniref:Uncharacterized protein n=1 Tax=Linderina pennispora TaxID=61395 RepID=A0A1Y1VTF4_9FUNG|nr:uncharacterized protein DL89DRAFT_175780 [Linderina pennispora]ORX64567.1 hypothetical protein DL89DRAFT_175780 [Linderina pennispora]
MVWKSRWACQLDPTPMLILGTLSRSLDQQSASNGPSSTGKTGHLALLAVKQQRTSMPPQQAGHMHIWAHAGNSPFSLLLKSCLCILFHAPRSPFQLYRPMTSPSALCCLFLSIYTFTTQSSKSVLHPLMPCLQAEAYMDIHSPL